MITCVSTCMDDSFAHARVIVKDYGSAHACTWHMVCGMHRYMSDTGYCRETISNHLTLPAQPPSAVSPSVPLSYCSQRGSNLGRETHTYM
jgi:hypothetical protein